jgi:hypothetical protein
MNKKVIKEPNGKPINRRKFEHIYEDEESTSIWKYDLDKQPNGPISVEIKYTAKYLKEMELKKRRGR